MRYLSRQINWRDIDPSEIESVLQYAENECRYNKVGSFYFIELSVLNNNCKYDISPKTYKDINVGGRGLLIRFDSDNNKTHFLRCRFLPLKN